MLVSYMCVRICFFLLGFLIYLITFHFKNIFNKICCFYYTMLSFIFISLGNYIVPF